VRIDDRFAVGCRDPGVTTALVFEAHLNRQMTDVRMEAATG
jgi:hypothetical protein